MLFYSWWICSEFEKTSGNKKTWKLEDLKTRELKNKSPSLQGNLPWSNISFWEPPSLTQQYHLPSSCFRLRLSSKHVNLWILTIPLEGWACSDFFKSFRSVLEQGPSAKSFRSHLFCFFIITFRSVPFRPIPFHSE